MRWRIRCSPHSCAPSLPYAPPTSASTRAYALERAGTLPWYCQSAHSQPHYPSLPPSLHNLFLLPSALPPPIPPPSFPALLPFPRPLFVPSILHLSFPSTLLPPSLAPSLLSSSVAPPSILLPSLTQYSRSTQQQQHHASLRPPSLRTDHTPPLFLTRAHVLLLCAHGDAHAHAPALCECRRASA